MAIGKMEKPVQGGLMFGSYWVATFRYELDLIRPMSDWGCVVLVGGLT